MPACVSLRWSLSSLSHAEGLRDGTHPLAARTCEPRPLTQARQIRPAAPVGALKLGARPTARSQDNPNGVGRFGGQAGPRPDPTPASPQNIGSRAGALIHILPAEYALRVDGESGSGAASPNYQFWCAVGPVAGLVLVVSSAGLGLVRNGHELRCSPCRRDRRPGGRVPAGQAYTGEQGLFG